MQRGEARRLTLIAKALDRRPGVRLPQGDGDLVQLFDLILVGDFVSLWLAAQEGIDPGPVPALSGLKAALASS